MQIGQKRLIKSRKECIGALPADYSYNVAWNSIWGKESEMCIPRSPRYFPLELFSLILNLLAGLRYLWFTCCCCVCIHLVCVYDSRWIAILHLCRLRFDRSSRFSRKDREVRRKTVKSESQVSSASEEIHRICNESALGSHVNCSTCEL